MPCSRNEFLYQKRELRNNDFLSISRISRGLKLYVPCWIRVFWICQRQNSAHKKGQIHHYYCSWQRVCNLSLSQLCLWSCFLTGCLSRLPRTSSCPAGFDSLLLCGWPGSNPGRLPESCVLWGHKVAMVGFPFFCHMGTHPHAWGQTKHKRNFVVPFGPLRAFLPWLQTIKLWEGLWSTKW